jgi:hypothetical protein
MHPKVLSAAAWRTVGSVVSAGLDGGWTLAGGTGLALQIGHRRSEDLDFFRAGDFDSHGMVLELSRIGGVAIHQQARGSLHVTLDETRLTFLEAQAPLLFAGTAYRGLLVADPRDIAVMKIVAIGAGGSRMDFVDLYFFLRSGGSLDGVFELMRRRFAGVDYNEYHLLKSLAYFEDAESEPMPQMLRRASWAAIKAEILGEVKRVSGAR